MFVSKVKEQHAADNGNNLPNLLMFAVLSTIKDFSNLMKTTNTPLL